ncbi:MAG TPA: BTAD domain-containing putative transcriptional regulator [Gaiellaceae bacterium]|nr:BTAD domain-containing putative transcriptional regulator [Gaiellaceae bacterium]
MATQFRILGPIEVLLDGRPAALGAPKQRALLALLLVNRRRVVPAEQLVDGLWGGNPPVSAVQSLQVYVHGLRRALGSERIETAGRGYRAAVAEEELDLDRFEHALERGRAALETGRVDDAEEDLRHALAVWRGPVLADLTEETRRAAGADRLEELRLTALELRLDAELASGRHDAVVAELETLTAEHPYRERFLEQRLLALYRGGRQAEALEVYRNARRALAEELGLEPSPSLQELERAILRQDPSLAAPVAAKRSTRPLPVPPTPLVGRRLELAAVSALFRDEGARLVTLTGPGGTGKTRLGLAVAHALEPELRDGALFVSLATISSPELLTPTIADALGVPEDEVRDHLQARRMLIALDNFEQLVEAAPVVADLLAAAPRVWVLATSRAPLRLAAEHEYPVPPFETPDAGLAFEALVQTDALRLFAARARAADPGFELDAAAARDVARVCGRLDGLPLAIELAAARSKLLAPGEILERLEREPNLLPPGPRDAPARHQTLAATISWSYDLLPEEDRVAFARLGVFSGGCTLEAAERVSEVTVESLATLVDNNLLRRRDSRFAMLETVRHFAVELLEGSGAAETRRRHAEWLTELAEAARLANLGGEDPVPWLDRLEAEHANIRAALGWAIEADVQVALELVSALRPFWEVRGHFAEGLRWAEQALAADDVAPPELRTKAVAFAAGAALRVGDLTRAEALYTEVLELAQEMDDIEGEARALSDLGTVAAVGGDTSNARRFLEESVERYRRLGVPRGLAIALSNLGDAAGQERRFDEAIAVTTEALTIQRELGDRGRAAISLNNLGYFSLQTGDVEPARAWLEECVALSFELGYKEVMAYALASFVQLCLLDGDAARAAHLAGVADQLQIDAGVLIQPVERALFEAAKAAAQEQLGDEYVAIHDAAMAEPLEQALSHGNVLAEARRS